MVISLEEGGPKIYIIISDSNLHHILPPQLENMTSGYKLICGF